jgi:nitrite reductase/ring-hydroxylating ferredoxin subunit
MTSIGQAADFTPGVVRVFQIEGRSVAVALVDNQIVAFDDICTHRGCSLSEGPLDGALITCPCHNSVFRVTDGKVVQGPAQTDIETFTVQAVGAEVHVSVPSPAPASEETTAPKAAPPASASPSPAEGQAPPSQSAGSLLAAVPLFSGLDQASLESLEAFTFRKKFAPGEVIVEEGRTGNGLYIVLSGRVEVVKGLTGPNPQVAAVLGSSEPFGEMALLGDWKRSASVRALEEVECLGMDRWAFLAHLNREPQLAVKMLQMLAERLAQTNERFVE